MGWAKYEEDIRETFEESKNRDIIYYTYTPKVPQKKGTSESAIVKSRKAAGVYIKFGNETVKLA